MPSSAVSQKQTSKASADLIHPYENSIPPPPFGISGSGASGKDAKHTAKTDSDTAPASKQIGSIFQNSAISDDGVIRPKPGCDVVAFIFVLLSLPQSLSCLVLVSYILSGSFRSLAGRYIANFLLQIDGGFKLTFDAHLKERNSYYRSELLGEFLQLFSVNSFILLVCHYTLPRAWFRYLVILAKSIIASKLVGTHTTGSTTYVSVVSNTANSAGTVTTTTTTNNGRYIAGSSKTEGGSAYGSLANFVTGFSFVIAANYLKDKMSRSNTSILVDGILDFLASMLPLTYSHEQANADIAAPIHVGPSLFEVLSWKESSRLEEGVFFSRNAPWPARVVVPFLVRSLGLSDRSVQRFASVSKEVLIIINFAYLVLCIHVISLTISPLFQRIFILRDYSKTLDHLSGLTPDVPYGGFKKGGLVSSIPHDNTAETTVINLEQHRTQLSAATEPQEIKVASEISLRSPDKPSNAFNASITAENFKVFCMKPPSSKLPIPMSKQGPSRTVVDRKRSNSAAAPSTTIVDKYYTISTQPIWTWLAAIKILFVKPSLLAGSPPEVSDRIGSESSFALFTLVSIEDARIIFEVSDPAQFDVLRPDLSISVNGVPWVFVESFTSPNPETKETQVFISVFGLSALQKYDVQFLEKTLPIGRHIVTTTRGLKLSHIPKEGSPGLLQSSLLYTMSTLNEMKLNFKKTKKEESKRVSELKRQVDALKSKIDKYGVTDTNEGRIDGKLRGLQNSVVQLENEIEDMERQIHALENDNGKSESEFRAEELKLNSQIDELESYINGYEQTASKLKRDVKSVEDEKQAAEAKLKKHESKMKSRADEIAKLNSELRGIKKSLIARVQKRQRKVHDRLESIIPKITEASEELNEQIKSFPYD